MHYQSTDNAIKVDVYHHLVLVVATLEILN